MVLYCVQHPAGILRAVIHKFKYHENEDAVIFGEYPIKSEYCQKIEGISYYQIPSVWSMVSFSQDRSALIQNIQSTIDCFMENLTLHFSDFSAIYAIYDMYNPFTVYFELNNIKYMCVELNNNVFKHYWDGTFIQTRCDKGKTFNELVYELHSQDGQGRNCLKGYLFSYESKVPEGGTVPLEVFDYYGTLLTLNERCKNQLIRAYDLDKYTFDCLMMFNSPGWTGTVLGQYGICLTYEEKKDTNENVFKFYKSVIDYYFNDIDFTLKLHPASGIDFSETFSCFEQLSNKILIELFALTGKQFRIICPINSSGEGVFRKLGFNITAFGLEIISFFKHIHFVKLAFCYIQQVTKPDKIYVYGLDINQMNYFKEFVFKPFKDVQIEQLTCENVKDAAYAVVVPNNEFSHVAELLGGECTIIVKGDFDISVIASRKMKCSVVDISGGGGKNTQIYSFEYSVFSGNARNIQIASAFCCSYVLKNANLLIQSACAQQSFAFNDSLDVQRAEVNKLTAENASLKKAEAELSEAKAILISKFIRAEAKLNNIQAELNAVMGELQAIKNSLSFKVGRMITFIPRKLRNALKRKK